MKVHEFIIEKVEGGLSQAAFARKCGISQALVNNVIQGHKSVSLEVTQKIADAYNLPLVYFQNEDADAYPHGTEKFRSYAEATSEPADQPAVYFPEVKWAADWMQIKITGKTPDERMKQIEEMMDVLRKEFK